MRQHVLTARQELHTSADVVAFLLFRSALGLSVGPRLTINGARNRRLTDAHKDHDARQVKGMQLAREGKAPGDSIGTGALALAALLVQLRVLLASNRTGNSACRRRVGRAAREQRSGHAQRQVHVDQRDRDCSDGNGQAAHHNSIHE
jgi:hypothetical protein